MAITLTPRIGLPQWSSGADAPSRATFNSGFLNADGLVAVDTGEVGGSALPTTNLVAGRYAQTVNGNYRALYRRDTAGWKWVGGNTIPETLFHRADSALATTAQAQQVSHPSLANPTIVDNWDGTGVRGGRLALLEQNSGAAAALHVGDASAADLPNRGRLFVRTTADGQRGLVLSAHGGGAGLLLSAQSGGSDSTTIDASGRFRTQVPSAFGAAGFTTNVPVTVVPGTNDVSGVDLYATSSAPAQRWWRATGDATPIGSIGQTNITLGRSTWSGGSVNLLAPNVNVTGSTTLTGGLDVSAATTLRSTLGVTGATTLSGQANLNGLTVVNNDLYVGGRFDLPTNQPSGTSSGQVRIATDWNLEVYDGSSWRGRFGGIANGKGLWTQSSANLSNLTNTAITGLAASSTQTPLATLSNGRVTLKRAGLWRLMLRSYCDPQIYASLRVWMNWSGGAFLEGPDVIGQGTNLEGWGGAGRNWAVAQWVGYVDEDAMANVITLYAHQSNRTSSVLTGITYWFTAEFLSN